MRLLLCKLTLALSALPLLMGAAVYRWVDENGVVNYTQLKPEGVNAELVSADTGRRQSTSSAPATTPESAAPSTGVPEEQTMTDKQQQMLSDLRAVEQARQDEIARVRESNCREARDVLQQLTDRGRIRVVGDDGQQRIMPDDERHERIDEAQRAVAANCTDTASR
jgi:hypothetical protein